MLNIVSGFAICSQLILILTKKGDIQSRINRSAIVCIDLKGDKGFLNSVRRFSEAAGRKFSWLTTSALHSWGFNPFSSFRGDEQDATRVGAGLLAAMQLDLTGTGFGANYFTMQTLALLYQLCFYLSEIKQSGRDPKLDDAIRYLQKNSKAAPRDSDQLISILTLLNTYQQLKPHDDDEFVIDMKRAIEQKEVVMVSVDSINQRAMARLFAGLMLQNTVAAATTLSHEHEGDPRPGHHTLVVIDEFHHIVGKSLGDLLTGAAGLAGDVSMCLSCQTTETIKNRDVDLYHAVRDNTAIKVLHTTSGEFDIKELLSCSRETTRALGSRKLSADFRLHGKSALSSESESDRLETQLTRHEVLEISATKNQALVLIDNGKGHREAIPTNTQYIETEAEFLASKSAPLPKSPSRHLSQVSLNRSSRNGNNKQPPWLAAHLSKEKTEIHQQRMSRFSALLQALQSEEQTGSKPE